MLAANLQRIAVVPRKLSRSRRKASGAVRGRPRVYTDRWLKVSVVLFERQVRQLDMKVAEIRRRTGRSMTRAELIRWLIDKEWAPAR